MDFALTEDHQLMSNSVRRYLADQYGLEFRNSVAHTAPYHSPARWAEMAELGLIGAFVAEGQGGFGGSGFDISTVFEELGRGLCPEPMLAALMAVRAAADCGAGDLVAQMVSGQKRFALAVFEHEADCISNIRTCAEKTDGGWILNGRKSVVYGLPGAYGAIVAAKTNAGISLFQIDALDSIDFAMIDGGGASELTLDHTPATLLKENAEEVIDAALDAGRLALCAEAVGGMQVLLGMTVDYLKQRQQFGQPIARFQALQHRVVDMAIEVEQSRSITILAASNLGGLDRAKYIAMAKNLIGRASSLIAEEAIQMHGGIGMTWEYPASHYAKRLTMIDHQLGDRYEQLYRVMARAGTQRLEGKDIC